MMLGLLSKFYLDWKIKESICLRTENGVHEKNKSQPNKKKKHLPDTQ